MTSANAVLRFILEVAALVLLSLWGWESAGWLLGLGLPIIAAAVWGIFNVPGDPSRSGKAPVPVPGSVRLVIEGAIFIAATAAAWAVFGILPATLFVVVVASHYARSGARIRWLLSPSGGE